MSLQLVREWPPGYGGIERVCHSLALRWTEQGLPSDVFSFGRRDFRPPIQDPLDVPYQRVLLPSIRLGRFIVLV